MLQKSDEQLREDIVVDINKYLDVNNFYLKVVPDELVDIAVNARINGKSWNLVMIDHKNYPNCYYVGNVCGPRHVNTERFAYIRVFDPKPKIPSPSDDSKHNTNDNSEINGHYNKETIGLIGKLKSFFG